MGKKKVVLQLNDDAECAEVEDRVGQKFASSKLPVGSSATRGDSPPLLTSV